MILAANKASIIVRATRSLGKCGVANRAFTPQKRAAPFGAALFDWIYWARCPVAYSFSKRWCVTSVPLVRVR